MRNFVSALILSALPVAAAAGECPALLNHQFKTLQGEKLDLCQYKDRGLVVIGFPSNDFRQEYATSKEIGSFCKLTYGVKFPMAESSSVAGRNANPFFKDLIGATGQGPQWNFHKYLITDNGTKVTSFSTHTEPDAPEIMKLVLPTLK